MTKPKAYGRRRADSVHVNTVLRADAMQAVIAVMQTHNLTRSGAIHHLVRLGAGLPPLTENHGL